MNQRTRQASQRIISRIEDWVKNLAEASEQLSKPADAEAFEQRFRAEGLEALRSAFETLMQNSLDHQHEDRQCPQCNRRRRHKGRRRRGLLSSVGTIAVNGVYWYCPDCGGQHAADALMPESISRPMQQLSCLLGVSLASFAKASKVSEKLLGVRISDNTIRRLCCKHGDNVAISPVPIKPETELMGSCDGTMIHTRQDGWRELKAYQYCYDNHRHGRAYLEPADRFVRRLRTAAVALRAGQSQQFTWVSDAAEWIDKGVAEQLPMAVRIIDIWHAWERVHAASRIVYPDDENKALRWAYHYCDILSESGGRFLCRRLRHCRYTEAERQRAVEKLRKYLDKNAARLDYRQFRELGYPISSGPMESFCKQLGQRLKGPGMRWNRANVTPMAKLVSLWSNDEWDRHWKNAA